MAAASDALLDDETLRMFSVTVRRFLETHATPAAQAAWRKAGQIPRSLWDRAAEAGLLGLSIPEAFGGAGLDFRYEVVLLEEIFRQGVEAFGAPLHNAMVAPYITEFGTVAQKMLWLPEFASGRLISAIAMTEPGAGSDLRGLRTTAVRDGDDYLLSGQKTYISNGQTADLIAVVAKTPAAGPDAVSILLVDVRDCPGFTRGRNLEKMGLEAADTSELFFENVRVPAGHLLGGVEGAGMRQLMAKLPQERLMIAIQGVVSMERALVETIAFTRDRRAFGKAIIEFQNTQFRLAECQTEATIARVFVNDCIRRHLAGELDAATASMAKYWVTEAQGRVVDACVQLHGGAGYMLEYPIARMYRDARAQRIYGGTNEIMKILIARSL